MEGMGGGGQGRTWSDRDGQGQIGMNRGGQRRTGADRDEQGRTDGQGRQGRALTGPGWTQTGTESGLPMLTARRW